MMIDGNSGMVGVDEGEEDNIGVPVTEEVGVDEGEGDSVEEGSEVDVGTGLPVGVEEGVTI